MRNNSIQPKKKINGYIRTKENYNSSSIKKEFKNKKITNLKIKKYLYLLINQRKENLNNFIIENKCLETRLKQFQKEKDKTKKNYIKMKKMKNKNFAPNFQEEIYLKELYGDKDPKNLKKELVARKKIFLEKCEELRNIIILTKGENLLNLSNESIVKINKLKNFQKNHENRIEFLKEKKNMKINEIEKMNKYLNDLKNQEKKLLSKFNKLENSGEKKIQRVHSEKKKKKSYV